MTHSRLVVGATAAAIAAAVLLFAGVGRHEHGAGGAGAAAAAVPGAVRTDGGDTAAVVERLQSQVKASPRNAAALAMLGVAYEQRARETADPAWYPKAEGVLRRALRLAPRDPKAVTALGSLALSQHRFGQALQIGRRARTLAPSSAPPYGVVGDALLELGRYDEAFAAFDAMARTRPSAASYARVAYARELIGRPDAALAALLLSREASGSNEATAWAEMQIGKLELSRGRYAAAAAHERAALRIMPGYPTALDALAQVESGRGNLSRAIALERRAVNRIPLPQFVSFLGDVLAAAGRTSEARAQYALVGDIDRLLHANGVRTDLELALLPGRPRDSPRAGARSRPCGARRTTVGGR